YDAAENEQHRNRADARDPIESDVAELEGAERLGTIIGPGLDHLALNGHVCHANPLSSKLFHATIEWTCRRIDPRQRMQRKPVCPAARRNGRGGKLMSEPDKTKRSEPALLPRRGRSSLPAQLLMSDDQVFSIILTTLSGIGM